MQAVRLAQIAAVANIVQQAAPVLFALTAKRKQPAIPQHLHIPALQPNPAANVRQRLKKEVAAVETPEAMDFAGSMAGKRWEDFKYYHNLLKICYFFQMNLLTEIEAIIVTHLAPYLARLDDYTSRAMENSIEIKGKAAMDDPKYFVLLRLGLSMRNQEMYIYDMFLPAEHRNQGIGLGLVATIYKIAKAIDFALLLMNTPEGFKEAMIRRGAISTDTEGCLQVVESTKL